MAKPSSPSSSSTPAATQPGSGAAAPDPPVKSFEAAIAELEKLVVKMESGSLSLEQSLASHQRGLELAKFCQGLLARAEQQVKVLEEDTLRAFPGTRGGDDDGDADE